MNPQTVLVTGAAGGIGSAIVARLRGAGRRVIATDVRLPAAADRVEGAIYVAEDLRDPTAAARLAAAVPEGILDGLVNAAGVAMFGRDGSVFDVEDDTWDDTMRVNLDGMRRLTRAALPLLRSGRGRSIVNIASIAGTRGMDSPLDAYQVSKAAVVSLSRSIAIQLGPEGIRCNTVCPGAISTAMIDPLYQATPARRDDMLARTPLRRLGTPEDVAAAVEFLLSDDASFITALDLIVDGGWSAQTK